MFSKSLKPFMHNCKPPRRFYCEKKKLTNTEITAKRNEIFSAEKKRQKSLITRVEKIQVKYIGQPENCTLVMNKELSTPFNCAMHMQEFLMKRTVLALVNGRPWDMHRPLVEDSTLSFLHFKDEDPTQCNLAFWRSCSFILGYVLERAFKDELLVELCSFPPPTLRSGSFVYDAHLPLNDWVPSQMELNCLSRIAANLSHEDKRFERLDVDASIALKLFADNRFKSEQIPDIAAKSRTGSVTVYRMGDHVDISRGPMIATTSHLGRFNILAFYNLVGSSIGPLTRVQGMALPQQLSLHPFSYKILTDRAKNLNHTFFPGNKLLQPPRDQEVMQP